MKKENTKPNYKNLYSKSNLTLFNARPSAATMFGITQKQVNGQFNQDLDDYSPKAEKEFRKTMLNLSHEFEKLADKSDNTEVMQNITRYFAGNQSLDVGYNDPWMGLSAFIINQINGPLVDVPNAMIINQQIKSLTDANDYIKRLSAVDDFVNSVLKKMNFDAKQGWIPPKVIISKSQSAIRNFLEPSANEHPLVNSFITKMQKSNNLTPSQQKELTKQVQDIVVGKVYPAYRKVIVEL